MTGVVGVDVGTQGTKAGVYLLDGTVVGTAYAEHRFEHPRPGWVHMDPAQIEEAVLSAVAQAVREAAARGVPTRSIAGLALSGICCGPVLVDDRWDPIRPIIPFLDVRAQVETDRIRREVDPRWVTESGTSTVDTYATPITLAWVRAHEPDVYARIRAVLSLAPYISGRLTGLTADQAFTDPTHLSGWILGWDADRVDFSPQQLLDLGIAPEITPRVVPSTHVVGGLTAAASQATGLPVGTPVAAGAGDIMQSNLAAGVLTPGQATDVAGTASLLTVGVTRRVPALSAVPGMLYSLATLPGQCFYWGYVKAGGLSLRWFRDQILQAPAQDEVYAALDREAASVPAGADGVLFLPYLSGGGPDLPGASGTWLGMTTGTTRATLWRSALESIAFEYADFLGQFADHGVSVSSVIGIGGGARSPLWNSVKAAVVGLPWEVPSRQDGAVLANAALAGVAVGVVPDLATAIGEWVGNGARFDPGDAVTNHRYGQVRQVRRRLLDGPLKHVLREGAALRATGLAEDHAAAAPPETPQLSTADAIASPHPQEATP